MKATGAAGMTVDAGVIRGARRAEVAAAKNIYTVECVRDGHVIWTEEFGNLVVDEGLDDLLTNQFTASGYTATWFAGLSSASTTPAAGDTMSSHGGWTEVVSYDEATREALVLGAVSGQSVDNSASKASFAINGSVTSGGAFVCTDGTKSGTAGTLYSIGAFASDKVLTAGDTLNVTVTLTMAAA